MKIKLISALLAVSMLSGTAVYAASDKAVDYLKEQNILSGDENGDLRLDSYVTRAEFAKIAVEAFSLTFSGSYSNPFTDISEEHWAYEYILAAYQHGLMDGFDDRSIRPDDYITYEQAIKMATIRNDVSPVYPMGYIANAIDYQCLDNIDASIGEYMTRRDIANLIYNTAQSMQNDLLSQNFFNTPVNDYGLEDMTFKIDSGDSESADETADLSNDAQFSEAPIPAPEAGIMAAGISGGGGGASVSISNYATSALSSSSSKLFGYSANINPYSNSESYSSENENVFKNSAVSPLSTFSIDTDTASYSNMRRFILNGTVPPSGSVRIEELINYFDYDLPQPSDGTPFSVTTELGDCSWNSDNKLAMISVQGESITLEERQPQNLVFLVDVSGSMYSYNKLPLLKKSLSLLLDSLDERDSISIVTYASGTDVKLSPTPASEKEKILDCINSLQAGGSTAGAAGLQLAYEQAEASKIDGNNRIILCTDGDFNVGITSNADLKDLVVKNRNNNIFLSILGFGIGNYKDDKLEIMADNGNGSYYYIDNLREAYKVLVQEMTQTLYTIAKDVKIQVEFNPAKVKEYRLIGYENRLLNTEDFEDDTKDAGELGSGAKVTALYELVMADSSEIITGDDSLRYQTSTYSGSDELMDVKLRYKLPDGDESILKEYPVSDSSSDVSSDNFRFASSVAELGMILNDSEYKGTSSYNSVIELAKEARGNDEFGFRTEFIQLVDLLRYINKLTCYIHIK